MGDKPVCEAIAAISRYRLIRRQSPVAGARFLRSPLMTLDLLKAFILGVVEGLTEFVPVSSTGHLLLVQRFFGFVDDEFGKTFAILIQFGAILALLSIYFFKLWRIAVGMINDPEARRFVIGV